MIDFSINKEQLEKNICMAAEQKVVLPNVAQLRIPDIVPHELADRGLFRMGWYSGEGKKFLRSPAVWEVPQEVSGVPCRILAMLGDAQTGAAFGCFLPKFVTGQAAWEARADVRPETDLSAAVWHYNVTGWALADVFEAEKRPEDRLFGVCFAGAEDGIAAAGDLIKGRYPRAKLAVGTVSLENGTPENCNARNLDVLCETSDALQCCIAVATYFELDEHDVLLTVLPGETQVHSEPCAVRELTYPEKKAIHANGTAEAERWNEAFWAVCYDQVMELDRLINEFNDSVSEYNKNHY